MKVLLHVCCAPCAICAVEDIRKDGHRVSGFFYNPNIHPYSEYLKRKDEVEKYARHAGMGVSSGEYDVERYFQHVIHNEKQPQRCPVCWWLRLQKTARVAKENGFDAFTTTLLGSPYQDYQTIRSISEDIAGKAGLKFFHKDFRTNFRSAHDKAKASGIYCQNYCGCVFSEKERIENKSDKNRLSGKKLA